MSIEIRREQAEDCSDIDAINRAAFGSEDEVRLIGLLRSRGELTISLVAVEGETVVGHVAGSPVTIGDQDCRAVGLGPMAVRASFRRRGVGASLIQRAMVEAAGQGFELAVLLGNPAYYTRFGFEPARPRGLDNEYGAGEAFLVMELCAGSLEGVRGLVKYVPAFGECDC